MAKKINQTPEESALYRDTLKLVKRANSRLARMEKATGSKGTFAGKQLYDYLDSASLNAVTKSGRISMKKSFTLKQLSDIKKATKEYLEEETSTVRGAKKYTVKLSKQAGKTISFLQASDVFQVRHNYQWIYEYFPGSSFWGEYGNPAKNGEITENRFVDEIYRYIKESNEYDSMDVDLKERITNLYYYCIGE